MIMQPYFYIVYHRQILEQSNILEGSCNSCLIDFDGLFTGNIRGSIIASVILTLLPELLRGLNDYRMLIYSIVLIVMMLFNWAPKCIEWREKVAARFKSKKSVKKEAE